MKSLVHSKQSAGFTLVEVMISAAIISILFGLTLSRSSTFSKQLFIAPADANFVNMLTTSARRARDGVGASSWGVYLPYNETTRTLSEGIVFKGTSYASRDTAYDQSFPFSDRVKFVSVDFSGSAPATSNSHEVIFQRYSGQTTMYGSVVLEVMGVERHVSVTSHGFVTKEL